MTNGKGSMDDIDRFEDGELEARLRAYAAARLSPDRWATMRMRLAVVEHGATLPAYASAGSPARAGRGRRFAWRPVYLVALVGALVVASGSAAAAAASPGGSLYGARIWVEPALVSLSGDGAAAQAALIDQRLGEAADAAGAGNEVGADAALRAYESEVSQAITQAAMNRADLEHLRAVIAKRLDHLQGLAPSNPKAATQITKAVTKAQAALAKIDAQLQSLGPTGTPDHPAR